MYPKGTIKLTSECIGQDKKLHEAALGMVMSMTPLRGSAAWKKYNQ